MGGNKIESRELKNEEGFIQTKRCENKVLLANESINETPYELGGMKVYSKQMV